MLTDDITEGDPAAVAAVAGVVEAQVLDESLVRLKLWTSDGTIVYSDAEELQGRTFTLGDDEQEALRSGSISAEVSDLSKPENRFELNGGADGRERRHGHSRPLDAAAAWARTHRRPGRDLRPLPRTRHRRILDSVDNSRILDPMPLEFDGAARVFAALADPARLRVLAVLVDSERCVCDIQSAVPMAANLLSYHLRTLREAGLVEGTRRGRFIDYRLTDSAAGLIRDALGGAGLVVAIQQPLRCAPGGEVPAP